MKMRRTVTLLLCLSFVVPAKPVTAQEDYVWVPFDFCVRHGTLYINHEGWHVIYCFNYTNDDAMWVYIPIHETLTV